MRSTNSHLFFGLTYLVGFEHDLQAFPFGSLNQSVQQRRLCYLELFVLRPSVPSNQSSQLHYHSYHGSDFALIVQLVSEEFGFQCGLLEVQFGVWCAGFQFWLRSFLPLLRPRKCFARDTVPNDAKIHRLLEVAQIRVNIVSSHERVVKKSLSKHWLL